jgi:hypothetical protein
MENCAEWLKPLVPEVPVEWGPSGDPFQVPAIRVQTCAQAVPAGLLRRRFRFVSPLQRSPMISSKTPTILQ